jgi:hypothetical protein
LLLIRRNGTPGPLSLSADCKLIFLRQARYSQAIEIASFWLRLRLRSPFSSKNKGNVVITVTTLVLKHEARIKEDQIPSIDEQASNRISIWALHL